jgi:hypothetical protein
MSGGPNYVKLFSVFIGHNTALPPVQSDPHYPHIHAITASIRLAITKTPQHQLRATQTSAVVTTTCLGYLRLHTRTTRPSTASLIYLYACSQRTLGGTPAPRSRPDNAAPAARDSNLGSGNHDMPGLSAFAYPDDAPIHGLTDMPPLRLLSADVWCGTPTPRSQTRHTRNTTTPVTPTPPWWSNYLPASPDDVRQMERTRMPIAPSALLILTDIARYMDSPAGGLELAKAGVCN